MRLKNLLVHSLGPLKGIKVLSLGAYVTQSESLFGLNNIFQWIPSLRMENQNREREVDEVEGRPPTPHPQLNQNQVCQLLLENGLPLDILLRNVRLMKEEEVTWLN